MARDRIYRRLYMPFVFILLAGLGGAWLAATQLFSETLEKRLHTQLTHTVTMLASGNFPYTPLLLQRLSRLIRADIALLDLQGKVTLSTFEGNQDELQRQFNNIINGQAVTDSSHIIQQEGHQYLLIWDQVSTSRTPRVAFIAAFADLSDIRDTSRRMASWLGAGALTGLLLLAWIGHLISRSITRPIAELSHMTREIAHGNRSVRATVHSSDEIGDLANAFNGMADKLDEYDDEIARQSRMATLGLMTARIAHEIRNPLTAIKMQLQLLSETTAADKKPVVDSLLDETRRLELIVLTTLQHKKIPQPVFSPADINQLIAEIVGLLRPQFEHQGLNLIPAYQPDLQPLAIDRDMITQILLNLLLNAKDEMPEGGDILLFTGHNETRSEIWFAIDDAGPGIAEEDWPTLFNDSTSNKPDGFGFGLRLCRELVELHQGNIDIQHSSQGGARFVVTLPIQRSDHG